MITFFCQHCGKPIVAKDETVGYRIACPHCAQQVLVRRAEVATSNHGQPRERQSSSGEMSTLELVFLILFLLVGLLFFCVGIAGSPSSLTNGLLMWLVGGTIVIQARLRR